MKENETTLPSRCEEPAPGNILCSTKEGMQHLFSYHRPSPDDQERIKLLREKFLDTGAAVLDHCGQSPETTLAIRQLHLALQAAITALVVHYAPVVKE